MRIVIILHGRHVWHIELQVAELEKKRSIAIIHYTRLLFQPKTFTSFSQMRALTELSLFPSSGLAAFAES